MKKRLILLITLSASAMTVMEPVVAQDITPAMDPAQIGHGQVLSSMGRTSAARRAARARRKPTQAQANACANRPRLRREIGASHPDMLTLNRLCRGVGL